MRPIVLLAALVSLVSLAACHKREATDAQDAPPITVKTEDGKFEAANGQLKIDMPGIDAKVSLPAIQLGGKDMDIDGMALAPGTKVTGIDVDAKDGHGNDTVKMKFVDGQPVAAVTAYYRKAAADAGFAVADTATGLRLTKRDKDVAVDIVPAGAGSSGVLTILDR